MAVDFKDNETLIPMNQNQNQNQNQHHHHRRHMDSGSEAAFIGSWGSSSSSSFLATSFGSELDSNDTDLDNGGGDGDEDEFIAELTRRMADYMLEENDDSGGDENPLSKHSGFQKPAFQEPTSNQNHEQSRLSYADTVKKSIIGFQSEQISTSDKQIQPPIQCYQVENQPRVGGQSGGWVRRGKTSESTQHMKPHRREQTHGNRVGRASKEFVNGGKGYSGIHGSSTTVGSGMRAIFLGGSGSRNVTSGTGVFLPRSATDATDQSRKKPGCSTVLIPTRVLQALEQHFNNMESLSPSNSSPQTQPNHHDKEGRMQTQSQMESVSVDHQKSKLPQEWIY